MWKPSPSALPSAAATKAAGQIEDVGAIDPLSLQARDPDWRVRANAATSLGQSKQIEALAGLAILAKDENVHVRTARPSASHSARLGRT